MEIFVLKNEYMSDPSKLPVKATESSTGFDIISVSDPEIVGKKSNDEGSLWDSVDYIQYRTGLFIETEKNYDVLILPRSSISKYNLTLANSVGLIDSDYRGEILVRFKYNWQPVDMVYVPSPNETSVSSRLVGRIDNGKIYKKGDRIGQFKVTVNEDVNLTLVDSLDETKRGNGGFGSTDASIKIPDVVSKFLNMNGPSSSPKKYIDLIKEREQK